MRGKNYIWLLSVVVFVCMVITFSISGCKTGSEAEEIGEEETDMQETTSDTVNDEGKGIFDTPTELVFWWYGEDEIPGFTKYIDSEVSEYMKLHPNITITAVHQGMDIVVPNFLAAAEAGSGPDIATMWLGLYQLEQVWSGYVAPLSDYVSDEEISHWYGKELSSFDGKVWASDLFGFNFSLIYNKDHFIDAGLDPEKPALTWDELMEYSGKLKEAGHAPFSAGFSGGWQFPVLSANIWPQYLELEDIKKSVVGEKKFSDPEFVNMWEKLDEYNKAGYFIESCNSIDFTDSWFEWRSGNATFTILSSPLALDIVEEMGTAKVGVTRWPQMSDDSEFYAPANPFSQLITSWSPNKELAADFLVFLHSEDSMNRMASILDGICIPVDDRFDTNVIQDPIRREVANEIVHGIKSKRFFTDGLLPWTITEDGLIVSGQALMLDDITPQEAADKMEEIAVAWRDLNPEYVENYRKWVESE